MKRITVSTWYQIAIPHRDGSVKLKEYKTEKGARRALARADRVGRAI